MYVYVHMCTCVYVFMCMYIQIDTYAQSSNKMVPRYRCLVSVMVYQLPAMREAVMVSFGNLGSDLVPIWGGKNGTMFDPNLANFGKFGDHFGDHFWYPKRGPFFVPMFGQFGHIFVTFFRTFRCHFFPEFLPLFSGNLFQFSLRNLSHFSEFVGQVFSFFGPIFGVNFGTQNGGQFWFQILGRNLQFWQFSSTFLGSFLVPKTGASFGSKFWVGPGTPGTSFLSSLF